MQPPHLLSVLPSYTEARKRSLVLSVLVPVYNERHLVGESLRKLLEIESDLLSAMEVIIVDDGSTDGSWDIIATFLDDPRVQAYRQTNQGKGAALRTALSYASGDVCVIHDADLEYDPADIPSMLRAFIEGGADAVYGSRYLSAPYRRALQFRHSTINRLLTLLTNVFTDLDLTDVETCYKLVNTTMLKSIPLRSDDFRFEIEITMKLAKRRARIFEVPIRYLPRRPEEGKKMNAWHGVLALVGLARYTLLDDMWKDDEYGSRMLAELQQARRFNKWMADTVRPFLGDRVLEIGAGVGNLTSQFIPRELYVASDVNPHYLHFLRSYSIGKPYLRAWHADPTSPADFDVLTEQFDTVVMLNALEHLDAPVDALLHASRALVPGGRMIVLVPQHPWLFGSLDRGLEHRQRYTRPLLHQQMTEAGLRVERMFDFNRTALPAWWFICRVLGRTSFSPVQLKMLEVLMPLIRRFDRLWPWEGISLVAVGAKEAAE